MKIASWNVNSVKARLPHLLAFLEEAQPDVMCLQETKCLAQDFPMLEVKGLGYRVETIGQRAYNGVALLSKRPAEEIVTGLLGNDEDELRGLPGRALALSWELRAATSLARPWGDQNRAAETRERLGSVYDRFLKVSTRQICDRQKTCWSI